MLTPFIGLTWLSEQLLAAKKCTSSVKLSLAEAQARETIGELCLYVRQLLYRNLLRTIFKYSRTKKDRAWLAEQILAN